MEIPNPQGQGRLIAQVIAKGMCVRCGACVGLCPYFDYFDGKVVVMDPCPAGTFRCLQVCPVADYEGTSPYKKDARDPMGCYCDILMARAADEEVVERSQYGGVVSALVIHALENGLISSAVLTDAGDIFAPKGMLVKEKSGVLDCAGSRYSGSGSLAALNHAIKEGLSRLGVVGLPCQMEALARMGLMQPDGEKRSAAVSLKIGLFCTWALDHGLLSTYLDRQGVKGPLLKSDIPPPPAEVFRVKTPEGWRDFPLSDIRTLIQKGCSLCEDMTADQSDISVGAAEGNPGWNTIIARTEKGLDLLKSAIKSRWLETADLPAATLDHLKAAARNKRERARQTRLLMDRDETSPI
jgi:coenzyme F420 hydrogenase subunit beta